MNVTTTIHGLEVQVEDESSDSIQCWIEDKRYRASASLACLQDTGKLYGNNVETVVGDNIIELIEKFATENGYYD